MPFSFAPSILCFFHFYGPAVFQLSTQGPVGYKWHSANAALYFTSAKKALKMNKKTTNYFSIFACNLNFALNGKMLISIAYFLFFYELFYR